ncbi:uncharacterized protein LOC124295510 isoform X2 [Neodiprion lecontei]|uniref:Uncharacterized protein LOC124295510 isoform X2 n=1 Tax=Neodiprion lecontei TaxID=441921 RepID=A0ABM3GNE1_NEOLC|nr:uncharacterized protein LOC124295510 isoform X2 [Neodiprion lecontei]
MKVNPINVIKLPWAAFEVMNIPESPLTNDEREIVSNFENILLQSVTEYNSVETIEENSLDFEEPYKNLETFAVEDADFQVPSEGPGDRCSEDDEPLSFDYKRRAVEYRRSAKTKKNRSIDTVRHRYKKVKSVRQLRRWAHQINQEGTYVEKLARISEYTLQNMKNAIDAGLIVHDTDLRRWALQAQGLISHKDFRFKASPTWLLHFKKIHRVTSRKINKFVTRKSVENSEYLHKSAEEFLKRVEPYISEYGYGQNIYNSDQSGFQIEIHSGRTLTEEGTKQVSCIVQSNHPERSDL